MTTESLPTPKDSIATHSSAAASNLLQGERLTGSYTRPDGVTVHHEITPDGMKQVRHSTGYRSGSTYATAAEFHAANGVAQPYELPGREKQTDTSTERGQKLSRAAKFLKSILRK